MSLRTVAVTLLMTAVLSGLPPSRMSAQTQRARPADAPLVDRQSAHETRDRLREVLSELPPSLAQVLRLDPSLMSTQSYLQPYPTLAAFLAQHPEVARNPGYFLGERFDSADNSRQITIRAMQDVAAGIGVFLFFMVALSVITYVSRSVLEHRRWLHATKVQTEAHTKLVDRLASNEDLMAYVQSAAGQRFLSASALQIEPESRGFGSSAPLGRIIGSIQVGVIAAFGGLGLWISRVYVINELAQPLTVLSILAVSLGLGFVVSALLAYAMSKQLGLIRQQTTHA